jgi:hypothetical protein
VSAPTRSRPRRQPGPDEAQLIDRATTARAAAEAATVRAATDTALAARALVRAGWSMRDIASALGLSYQRVHQIVHLTGPRPEPTATHEP